MKNCAARWTAFSDKQAWGLAHRESSQNRNGPDCSGPQELVLPVGYYYFFFFGAAFFFAGAFFLVAFFIE